MNEQSREHLSALLDGESDELSLRRLLAQADDASGLRKSWHHYQMISDALHERPMGDNVLADRVRWAIDDEPEQQTVNRFQSWTKPLSHLAVAASFAAVVFVGASYWLPGGVGFGSPADQSSASDSTQVAQLEQDVGSSRFGLGASSALPVSYSTDGVQSAVPESLRSGHYIRLGDGLGDYLQRHQQRMDDQMSPWQLGWKPEGFELKSQDVSGDQQVMTYAGKEGSFSVFIEPLGLKPRLEGSMERQGKTVLARQLLSPAGDCYVTVAGDLSPDTALSVINHLKNANEHNN
ncbi:MucB/RseB C-terminal domain-containing protein [Pokkaliibacter sp. CJK22405]|uniref:MucB/RseB C-terminal domain-containing protein n=1 Tax=Pokkaliibacter sp. CJK22405 TaxID=3384615 RepID=UPI00398461E5